MELDYAELSVRLATPAAFSTPMCYRDSSVESSEWFPLGAIPTTLQRYDNLEELYAEAIRSIKLAALFGGGLIGLSTCSERITHPWYVV